MRDAGSDGRAARFCEGATVMRKERIMKGIKKVLNHIFIDGLSGMASGLFATLIIGTILAQIADFVPGTAGEYIGLVASATKAVTGAGIGVGVACKFKCDPLVTVSAASAGMVGAFASKILAGTFIVDGAVTLAGPGDPLSAFIAALVGIEIGRLVSKKTGLDIIVTPICSIASGSIVGLIVGPPCSELLTALGQIIIWATEQQPFIMGIVVSAVMGIVLTLPISSAALGVILGLTGISAGAATVGCAANMVGFAVASFKENGWGGLISQGVGTSMIQVPNIMRRPAIWLPAILASVVLGPVSTCVLGLTNNAVGCGMGTSGLVGPITMYQTMVEAGASPTVVLIEIIVMLFVAPGVLAWIFGKILRKWGWIRENDMKLEL